MIKINTDLIKEAVYKLCLEANTRLDKKSYEKILNAYNTTSDENLKTTFKYILKNAKKAFENKTALCQDTGQVIVFLTIGQNVFIEGEDLYNAINSAVERSYRENFFRKSTVKDALCDRTNTNTNTPVIIHTEIISGDEVRIEILIKGAGSENKSKSKMLLPTASKEDIKQFVAKSVIESGLSSCPPLFVGIGIGGTADKSAYLAKKALLKGDEKKEIKVFAEDIKEFINENSPADFPENYVLELNIISSPTHIACLPISVSINCHSSRKAGCIIKEGKIFYDIEDYAFIDPKINNANNSKKLNTSQTEEIQNLKEGDNILLSGELYIARDAAHKRIIELIEKKQKLPIEIKDKIIFYAGPCPAKPGTIIGPVGPTTASRMDNYAETLYNMGLLATIGKGERSENLKKIIRKNNGIYFTLTGGIASLISEKITKCNTIAFEELGAEAIYKIQVKNFPLKIEVSKNK